MGTKDYTSIEVQAKMKDAAALEAIQKGVKEGERTLMRGVEGDPTDEEIRALVACMCLRSCLQHQAVTAPDTLLAAARSSFRCWRLLKNS